MNTAIIVAAGSGTRFGSKLPKQFIELAGKPIVLHSIDAFSSCPLIDSIIVVTGEQSVAPMRELVKDRQKVAVVVAGAETRAGSAANGLAAVDAATEIVLVHDAVRPLVSVIDIENVISAAQLSGAACLVDDVTDTIKRVDGDLITETLDRSQLRRALTPQAFRLDILKAAFRVLESAGDATDEASMVESTGVRVTAVPCRSYNIKITRPQDLLIAEALIANEH